MKEIELPQAAPREEAGHVRALTILERSIYRGPHFFSNRPMIRIQVDLGTLEEWPTDRLPLFAEHLMTLLPGLAAHGCSYQEPGGLVRRLQSGTWLGHVIEHVALELQCLAGARVTRGKTRSVKGRPGVYNILYAYQDEEAGLEAGACAIAFVLSLVPEGLRGIAGVRRLGTSLPPDPRNVGAMVETLRAIMRRNGLGPTTAALVRAAERRGIPVVRLNDQSLIQLGLGSRQKRIRASITGDTSQVAVDIAGDKNLTKRLLDEAGLPVPRGGLFRDADAALAETKRLGWPLVIKPLDGNHGRGVTTGIRDEVAFRAAFDRALRHGRRVIVEQQLPGQDHRLLVIGGKLVAVAERRPAHVAGDGRLTIAQLIEEVNRDPRRGTGHEDMLTRIVPDDAMAALLARAGRDLDTVPAHGETVQLRDTANLSTGGTAIDRTDDIHPLNRLIAEQAAATVGLDVCGIDFLSPDISRPVNETGGGIVEVNAAPGFRMHLEPSSGPPRDVAAPVIDALFPPGRRSRIPIFAITGTNGKSTTVRMVERVLSRHGLNVGMTTTSGIHVGGQLLKASDASGPRSARSILRNPTVDAAVLETARGGILREGLGFDGADVGAVLNVTPDHLGLKGIDTLEDLANVKAVVVESVARRGYSVLNADDPMCVRIARHARGTLVWFSLHGGDRMPEPLRRHIEAGGIALMREPGPDGGMLVIHHQGGRIDLMPAAHIPVTLNGIADFNIANALAAAAMCFVHGVPVDTIRESLATFTNSFSDSPGRLNIRDAHGRRFILDYAHNPAGLTALGQVVDALRGRHRRVIGMVSIPGDRRDSDIIDMGGIAAAIFDEIIFREAPDGRGRPPGETNGLMSEGALRAGAPAERVHRIVDELEAVQATLKLGRPGDLLVILPTSVGQVWQQVLDYAPDDIPATPARKPAHA
ncbi:cyanophycin synthetase [Sphingobium indicum]|uniref:Cyanophycin synthetase n=1 Tax=Sphingobium indicum F2 TaxID=1450518 RepID=A0A8E0WUN0_9SPHN|nr:MULTISPECIES: cyanophycin synthetase [Sphingobium]EQB06485.1 cyanophycin synthetase [Sphingobium sp. HDIP04]KER37694.1 cyanophycin synthetase [Sphingobium indicum F2]